MATVTTFALVTPEQLVQDAPLPDAVDAAANGHRAAVAIAVVVGAILFFIAAEAVPYHIDELRQVASYERSYAEIVEESAAVAAPPLNVVLGASVQRVLGVGDVWQRLVSVLAGIGALVALGFLTLRAGFRYGAAAAVLALALTPVMVAITAYARPYALPLFLSLFFLLMVDIWLTSRSPWAAAGLVVSALLLPLARSTEPLLVLAGTIGVLVLAMVFRRAARWPGSPVVPIGAAGFAIIAVGIPVLLALRSGLEQWSAFTMDVPAIIARAWPELPLTFADLAPLWPVVLIVIVAALLWPLSRRSLIGQWWWWVLVLAAAGYVAAFYATSSPGVPYFDRFSFMWWPPIAVAVGALVAALTDPAARASRAIAAAIAALVGVFFVASTVAVISDLGAMSIDTSMGLEHRPDWEAASNEVIEETSDDALVLFDVARPTRRYRSPFYGAPRYIDDTRLILSPLQVIVRPPEVGDRPVAVVTLGDPVDVAGWSRSSVDLFNVYVPDTELRGVAGTIEAMVVMGEAHGPDVGATWGLAAAVFATLNGQRPLGCTIMTDVLEAAEGRAMKQRIDLLIGQYRTLSETALLCGLD